MKIFSTTAWIHNDDFYFKTGGLDGNELVRKFTDVVRSYEMMNVKIFGLVGDGGGVHQFFKIL